MSTQKQVSAKIRKKVWYTILAPQSFNQQVIGEIPSYDINSVMNRFVEVNLMVLTANPKHQGVNVKFMITEQKSENKVGTKVVSYSMIPANIRRFVRRSKEKIDDSFRVRDAKGEVVVIKPFMVTRFAANKSKLTDLRRQIREFSSAKIKTMDFEALIIDCISSKFQRELKDYVKNICPLKVCEIRETVLKGKDVKGDVIEGKAVAEPPKASDEEKADNSKDKAEEEKKQEKEEKPSEKKEEPKKKKEKEEETEEKGEQ